MWYTPLMACIGGTVAVPRPWWRFHHGDEAAPERMWGRVCDRVKDRTNRRYCDSCPAYRGLAPDGVTVRNGAAPNGSAFYSMRDDEYRRWNDLLEAMLDDDENMPAFVAYDEYLKGASNVYGVDTLRRIGDPDALAAFAARVRARRNETAESRAAYNESQRRYRAAHQDHNRAYDRERKRRERAAVRSMCPLPRALEGNHFSRGST